MQHITMQVEQHTNMQTQMQTEPQQQVEPQMSTETIVTEMPIVIQVCPNAPQRPSTRPPNPTGEFAAARRLEF
jgi:hypothetical protein